MTSGLFLVFEQFDRAFLPGGWKETEHGKLERGASAGRVP